MYCIKCGVELADSEKKCPLCGLTVYHPDIQQAEKPSHPFPKYSAPSEQVSTAGAMFVVTVLFLIPLILCPICDFSINSAITWSGYAALGLALGYVIFALPGWFTRPNPVVFVPVDFAAVALYLAYISFATGGGWFLTFALPVTGGFGVIVTAVVTIVKYVRRGKLYVFGGAMIAIGGMMVLMDMLINLTFATGRSIFWSIYPLITLSVLGMMLIVIAICRPLRESLYKKFFI